ncbi:MAG TPA: DUF4214 domain-containing protein [Iamia sp.]|nr:DUF4214 domain-containing protein [Iamia sp.]
MTKIRRALALFVGLCLTVTIAVGGAPPASALTGTEKFIMAVHEDFLLRTPSANEMTWWTAYLGGSSRTSMVSSVLSSDEFKRLWVFGISEHYTGGTTTSQGTITSNLISSGDFVASEVALVSGSFFFDEQGGTNTTYVEGLYQKVLLRASDSSGLTYWVGRLNAATATRASVANHFIRTLESATRRVDGLSANTTCPSISLADLTALTSGTYCIVLDRMALSTEVTYWAGQLTGTDQLPSLWASVAGSTEYYNNAQLRF